MRLTIISIFIFAVCIINFKCTYGQQQKNIHNGFVAATNQGVYYLQDGFDEWVSLGNLLKPSGYKRNYDTILSINHFKDNLSVIGYSQHNNSTGIYTTSDHYTVFGRKLTENTNDFFSSGLTITMTPKNSTNKLKDKFILDFDLHLNTGMIYIRNSVVNYQYGYSTYPAINYFTSLATDNDSILVWTGTNNTLYKTVISETVGNRSNVAITGLVSNVASGHQICYDSNNDLFWIVSDEGIVYTYNKTTVDSITTLLGSFEVDSITDIAYDAKINDIHIAFSHGIYRGVITYDISANEYYKYTVPEYSIPIQLTVGSKKTIFNTANSMFELNQSDFTDIIHIADLPSGVVVYDLDYIDYLPFIAPQNPTITLLGNNPDTLWLNQTYVDAGVTAYDFQDGDITSQVQTSNNINNTIEGEYEVLYEVVDDDDNYVTVSRIVYVVFAVVGNPVVIGGETYQTVILNDQTWLQRNLHYNDGLGGIYSYNNETDSSGIYGYLYSLNAAARLDTLINGWHLPSGDENSLLISYLGGYLVAGGKLKEDGLNHWADPNQGASNTSLLTFLPSGYRHDTYGFLSINYMSFMWYVWDSGGTLYGAFSILNYNSEDIGAEGSNQIQCSVRLIKDTP
jgi:uncharacterized protein (TIGR02145 family)